VLTFLVPLNGSPSTRAIQGHLASLPSRDEALSYYNSDYAARA
jgi:hypothetical protein